MTRHKKSSRRSREARRKRTSRRQVKTVLRDLVRGDFRPASVDASDLLDSSVPARPPGNQLSRHECWWSGVDVPLHKLVPGHDRAVTLEHRQRIEASIRTVGLMDRLIVCRSGDGFTILDGCLRFQILSELGMSTVPCLVRTFRATQFPPT
jgi:hypothetical protein